MLSQNYDPKQFEKQVYLLWQKNQVGSPENQEEMQETFQDKLVKNSQNSVKNQEVEFKIQPELMHSILMPPPNLTGLMHAGHSFQHFLMDTLSRINRQKGNINAWFPGVDHAGLQLEGVIDKMIKKGDFDIQIEKYFEALNQESTGDLDKKS